MSRAVVDSSVFIAFYWQKDTQHEKALRVMADLASATLVVHPYVIQEVAAVLTRKLNLAGAKVFLADIAGGSNIDIAWVDAKADIEAFQNISMPLSFTDVALVRLAKASNLELITFDRQMLSLYASK